MTSDWILLKIKKLVPHAELPYKGSVLAAGYDLVAAEDICVKSKNK